MISVLAILKAINYTKKTTFIIDQKKYYFLIKSFLISQNLPFIDKFMNQEEEFEALYNEYKNDPSDENFLNVLSHPLCEQKSRFIEIEKYLAFPRKKFEHFQLCTVGNETSTCSNVLLEDLNVSRVLLYSQQMDYEKDIEQTIFTSEWLYS